MIITHSAGQPVLSGERVRYRGQNNSKENVYIQSVCLNGQALNSFHFPHPELVKGVLLEIDLGSEPIQKTAIPPVPSPR